MEPCTSAVRWAGDAALNTAAPIQGADPRAGNAWPQTTAPRTMTTAIPAAARATPIQFRFNVALAWMTCCGAALNGSRHAASEPAYTSAPTH